jgi:uroporphyrinogen-III synthase
MPAELSGQRIVITRPRHQAQAFGAELERLGAEVVYLPVIEIGPPEDMDALDAALERLAEYDWVIFTSVNGVRTSLDRIKALGDINWPAGLKVAAIGPKTAAALQAGGIGVDFTPDEYIAEAIPPGLGAMAAKKFLLLRADLARPVLAELIETAGGLVDEVTAYRTLPARPDPQAWEALQKGIDVLTFTSSSTVRNFRSLLEQSGFDPAHLPGKPKIACIGPITAGTARELGLAVDLVAVTYTIEGLVTALRQGLKVNNQSVRKMP